MRQTRLLLFLLFLTNIIFGQETKLILISSADNVMVNEDIQLKLYIEGVDSIIKKGDFEFNSTNQFVYNFTIKPTKDGPIMLGPYKINFNGTELTSNSIKINVSNKDLKSNTIYINIPKKSKIQDEIKIQLISKKTNLSMVTIKENQIFDFVSRSHSTSTSVKDGIIESESKITFIVKFKIKGNYNISNEWFENIPETLNVSPERIIIE